MAALAAPAACIELNAGAVHPGVIKGVVTAANFFSGHKVNRGVLKDHLWGQPIVGIGLSEGNHTVVVLLLEFE